MSYSSVTAANVSPNSPQPRPDPALLNTTPRTTDNIADDAAKVNVVGTSFKEDPHTYTSEAEIIYQDDDGGENERGDKTQRDKAQRDKTQRGEARRGEARRKAETEGARSWELAKRYFCQPEMAGGCIGLVNVGLLAGLGRALYIKPSLRRDTAFITSAVVATVGLLSTEAYVAERYHHTSRGKEKERRVREEGVLLYRKLRELMLGPNGLYSVVGIANTAVFGTLGYLAYTHWGQPHWDRRVISSVGIGLIALFSGEGWLAGHN